MRESERHKLIVKQAREIELGILLADFDQCAAELRALLAHPDQSHGRDSSTAKSARENLRWAEHFIWAWRESKLSVDSALSGLEQDSNSDASN